jgi:hypothetical protein
MQLTSTLKRELLLRKPFVVVLDRLRTLSSLGDAFPHDRLCGHGFSGPLTDLHARMVLALLCWPEFAVAPDRAQGRVSEKEDRRGVWAGKLSACGSAMAPGSLPRWVREFH